MEMILSAAILGMCIIFAAGIIAASIETASETKPANSEGLTGRRQ